jgi:NAD(P)-dependent dehydrogenase (short-subunit alcohol dehydrogenase family)
MRIDGSVALVTGADRGLGRVYALEPVEVWDGALQGSR